MQRKLILEFTKMNGSGNDFVVIDNRFYYFSAEELEGLAKRLCRRRLGVGADGLLIFMNPDDETHHYRMKYYNADGSVGTMCGNGACCLARFAQLAGFTEAVLYFESDAGVYRVEPGLPGERVRLYVPDPKGIRLQVPHKIDGLFESGLHYIWTGTEHAVYFVEEGLEDVPVERLGPEIRTSSVFEPNGVNVNFVQVDEPGNAQIAASIRVRTYEKGVECETLACGTGALASAILAGQTGAVPVQQVDVHMPGGILGVGYREENGQVTDVFLEGNVETVYRGTLEV